jgi:hypothetical protein
MHFQLPQSVGMCGTNVLLYVLTPCSYLLQNILDKFNPGARQLINAGKAYLKALHGEYFISYFFFCVCLVTVESTALFRLIQYRLLQSSVVCLDTRC